MYLDLKFLGFFFNEASLYDSLPLEITIVFTDFTNIMTLTWKDRCPSEDRCLEQRYLMDKCWINLIVDYRNWNIDNNNSNNNWLLPFSSHGRV